MCKPNVEGSECDQCKEGTFDLEETNPDGCKDCFCFGKTAFCSSHDRLVREKVIAAFIAKIFYGLKNCFSSKLKAIEIVIFAKVLIMKIKSNT
jgi:hypothetical protein